MNFSWKSQQSGVSSQMPANATNYFTQVTFSLNFNFQCWGIISSKLESCTLLFVDFHGTIRALIMQTQKHQILSFATDFTAEEGWPVREAGWSPQPQERGQTSYSCWKKKTQARKHRTPSSLLVQGQPSASTSFLLFSYILHDI